MAGCAFFLPEPEPPPDLSLDGILSCGEQMPLVNWSPGTELDLDVGTFTSVEVLADFDEGGPALRLVATSDTALRRAVELWDPLLDRRTLPGFRGSSEDLSLERIGGEEDSEGNLSLECSSPGEMCFNVQDDDGDGAIDCADLHCARDSNCIEDQEDLTERLVTCSDDYVAMDIPGIDRLDSQRTLYRTTEGTPEHPADEFRGGAEIVILEAPGATAVSFRFGSSGLLCAEATLGDTFVDCPSPVRVQAEDVYEVPVDALPVYLEPDGDRWVSVEARGDCDPETRDLSSAP